MPEEISLATENARLRARIEALELELAQHREQTAQTVARAQETLYWFERWGVDFNALFSRREMELVRRAVRAVRGVYRAALKVERRLTGNG